MLDRIISLFGGLFGGAGLLLLASGSLGCATTANNATLLQGGLVDPQDLVASLRCPRGTTQTQGQTMGVVTAIWCEKPGNIKHGAFVEWYENHQKKDAGEYVDGRRQGTWVFWLPGGQQDSTITYEKGEVISQTAAPVGLNSAPTATPPGAPAQSATPAPAAAPAPALPQGPLSPPPAQSPASPAMAPAPGQR